MPPNSASLHSIAFLAALTGSGCHEASSAAPTGDASDSTSAIASSPASAGADTGADGSGSDGSSGDAQHDTGDPPDELPTDGFLGGFFPIGVFGQQASSIDGWAGIGCNTMLGLPNGENIATWDAEAQRLGMAVIRPPIGAPSEDAGRTDLLAWLLPDEPDVEANNAPCGGNCVSLIESMSSQWRQADPSRKIFVNVAGPNVLLEASCDYCNGPGDEPPSAGCFSDNDQCYPRIFETADWVSQDLYPVTGWLPSEDLRDDITIVGRALDKLRGWTDKPLFAIIEVSDQRLGFDGTGLRGPTADEYRAELWHAILHGARGVFYFPQAFNPFDFEAIAPGVLDEMIVQHATIGALGPLLQAEADPAGITVTVDAPLEVTWRQTDANAWVFALNTSSVSGTAKLRLDGVAGDAEVYDESRTLPLEDSAITDDFAPYALHIYVLPRN